MNSGGRAEVTPPECVLAAEMFDHFCSAGTMKQILALHREICNTLTLKPTKLPDFYPKLKSKLVSSWKAQALFKKFDARAGHKVYGKGHACKNNKVLIIGAGPCGLRAAIECQLLGAKVVVIEKRDRMSRNNVLHLWPFVIQDLRALGAKKFFGKFCAGSIDHISIRQLQCILLKVALLLGVEFHEGVSFEELLEPKVAKNSETLGWRARVTPAEHPVSQYEFDALMGADGKRNTLQGFKRKEFRGKLAMAITANFINRHTETEASVPEISGVAFIFNQKFFRELKEETGIDLENIVYYKDDTHYFVMTAKKHSLIDKGVLLQDHAEVSQLLHARNVDREALMRYAMEAARFSTGGRLPLRDFALNHYGEPDVALFDFTSMYAAENASLVLERLGRRLLCQLVGDSLLEPFWPTGSGCARGFLSALDAAWAVRAWGFAPSPHPLHVIAERESIYRLLAQTTPENLHRDFGGYTLDPGTRYPNLNRTAVTPHRVTSFYDSDDPQPLDASATPRKRRRVEDEVCEAALVEWVGCKEGGVRAAVSAAPLAAVVRRYRPDLLPDHEPTCDVYRVLHHHLGITPFSSSGTHRGVSDSKLRSYLNRVYNAFKGEVPHIHHEQSDVFDQIKTNMLKDKSQRTSSEQPISAYTKAADMDVSHSSYKRRRRVVRTPQVSTDPCEYIRKKINKLALHDVTHLAQLLERHDKTAANIDAVQLAAKQQLLQEQIICLLDPDESPDPILLRDSLHNILQGNAKTILGQDEPHLRYFHERQDKPVRPPRKLKGLDPRSRCIKLDNTVDSDATIVNTDAATHIRLPRPTENKGKSWEDPILRGRRPSNIVEHGILHFQSSDIAKRSHSTGPSVMYTKHDAPFFNTSTRMHSPSPESRSTRSGAMTDNMAMRLQRMVEITEGRKRNTPSPDRFRRASIENPEIERRKRLIEDFGGRMPHPLPELVRRRNSVEISLRLKRVADIIQKNNAAPKTGGRRKAARDIMKQRFEKSLAMLAVEPRVDVLPSTVLEHDYGLQQYRASAPHFGDRVKKLERQLQHYEEGRIVGGGRASGRGARVAKLAAELSGNGANTSPPRPSKPKDLMRSVGKIERDDWNMKEIERKINENKLGRPEPKTAEKVPKWDREQFLGRQRKLKEGDAREEKWGEIDETLQKLDQKLRDSGRPDLGTNKVANLANKFVKKDESELPKPQSNEEAKKSWRGMTCAGEQCAGCGARVFAAEAVTADGLTLHRACFRCARCKAVLRPGNYTMERHGSRLVCLRHSGPSVPDAAAALAAPALVPPASTPERISLELSDGGAREIDEDEWTDRNFLASETSGAGGLSEEEESSSEEYTDTGGSAGEGRASPTQAPGPHHAHSHHMYFSDDSFGYDYNDYSDEGSESSGNESCSRLREAREARRREVPAEARPPSCSSEVESDDDSDSSSEEVSSATEVSTDSEFAREEIAPAPPSILVTEAPAHPPAIAPAPTAPAPTPPAPAPPFSTPALFEYPLSRTRSAGGLATKRALELKRKYLLGEPSPPAVRKSDSTSQIDNKFEAFRSNITEFQKLLHPAATVRSVNTHKPIINFQISNEDRESQPMPDIIKNLCVDAPVDLLTKTEPFCEDNKSVKVNLTTDEKNYRDLDLDSLSEEDSLHTETVPKQSVPRVEVHDEGGELIQMDSLMMVSSSAEEQDKASVGGTATGTTVVAARSESSESGRDATTLALTETELSDWAAEADALGDSLLDDKHHRTTNNHPRTLSGPKLIHDAKNITTVASHVCGRTSPSSQIEFSNALEHFEFVDEGVQDPSIETPSTPKNEGYMELVDGDYEYSPGNDRSINFIERSFSEMIARPECEDALSHVEIVHTIPKEIDTACNDTDTHSSPKADNESSDKSISDNRITDRNSDSKSDSKISDEKTDPIKIQSNGLDPSIDSLSITEVSPQSKSTPFFKSKTTTESVTLDDISLPLVPDTPTSKSTSIISSSSMSFSTSCSMRLYSPAICRSASETFNRSTSHSTGSPTRSFELSHSVNLSSGSVSPVSPIPPGLRDTTGKVQELKQERERQTELVRKLVLERLGTGARGGRRGTRRMRAPPHLVSPPPVPPPPVLPEPPAPPPPPLPPRPATPLLSMPVTPSLSDPELARERRRNNIMKSISNYLNRHLGPRQKGQVENRVPHKSTGALQEAPPVPPPPAGYSPPDYRQSSGGRSEEMCAGARVSETEERDAMQLWFEARWARLVAQRRTRDANPARDESTARRLARLERRLTRPLSAEQQAATVAELVQVSAQREAHQALMEADRRRNAESDDDVPVTDN